MAEEATQKSAEKVYTLEDIHFNEANKTMAILACIPIVGLILLFTEKDDKFVRYMAAQFTIAGAVPLVSMVFWFALIIFIVMGMVKASKGERYDVPVISGLALKLMGKV
jgi:uncharacterized membrane protein